MLKSCLDCGKVIPKGNRCGVHQRAQNKAAKVRRGPTPNADKMSRELREFRRKDPAASFTCVGCGMAYLLKVAQVDHVHELIDGGADDIENLRLLCRWCHAEKSQFNRQRRTVR